MVGSGQARPKHFVSNKDEEIDLVLDDRAWRTETELIAHKWKELASSRSFESVRVQVDDEEFELRDIQQDEIAKWGAGKKYNTSWLRLTEKLPSHFVDRKGVKHPLVLLEDAWMLPEQKTNAKPASKASRNATQDKAPPAKKARNGPDWEAKLAQKFNLAVGASKDVVKEWTEQWYCYWDDSCDMPADPVKDYVFSPSLVMTKSGLVRPRDCALLKENSAEDVFEVLTELEAMKGSIGETIGHGDESDYGWHPFAIAWTKKDGKLSAGALLKKLGAHSELMGDSICELDDDSMSEEEDDEEDLSLIHISEPTRPY
eukprot:TRINITY_DN20487_c0_g1_i2.p1 TRINITY_DN20487_c0_g1~~TRINITY_DN20487_c0_g1_i2.p1  ORF type:complete len:315 (-),score=93.46 TRINITY_DN20487_c0_g1_i2:75-1019(-)